MTSRVAVWSMTGTSVVTWVATAAWFDRDTAAALLLGMLGPLTMTVASWVATERTYRRKPERVTSVMMAAFGLKMLFVGAYLLFALRGLAVPPLPFLASFTGYFIVLYGIEALFLKRLFEGVSGGPR